MLMFMYLHSEMVRHFTISKYIFQFNIINIVLKYNPSPDHF